MADKDTSEEAGVASLMALLGGTPDDEETTETTEESPEGADDEETPEGDETPEGEETPEGDDDEEEGAAPKVVSEKTVVFTLKDGDKDIPVTAEEAKAGMMLQADYSRKTQELADVRKTIQAERAELSAALGNVLASMDEADEEATPAKLAELARTDPEKATQLKFDREARAEAKAKIVAAQNELNERTAKEQKVEQERIQKEEIGKLVALMPELKDPTKAKAKLAQFTEALVAVGFEANTLHDVVDHRLMRLLDLAALGLRLSKKPAPKPEPKGNKVPALVPGVRKLDGKNSNARRAHERFKETRSFDDAAASLEALLTPKSS